MVVVLDVLSLAFIPVVNRRLMSRSGTSFANAIREPAQARKAEYRKTMGSGFHVLFRVYCSIVRPGRSPQAARSASLASGDDFAPMTEKYLIWLSQRACASAWSPASPSGL